MTIQRAIMTQRDFESELNQILVEGIPNRGSGPDGSQIAKASDQTRMILDLMDRFLTSNGVIVR